MVLSESPMREYILTNQEAAAVDHYVMKELGIAGRELMSRAGRFVALKAKKLLDEIPNSRIDIFCGTGNNGGDGLMAALKLNDWGANVSVWIVGDSERLKGDARYFYEICREKQINPVNLLKPADLQQIPDLSDSDLIVDALLGTGFRGAVTGLLADVVDRINTSQRPVLAVDIPSGIDGDTGQIHGTAVKATVTVTMGFLKRGLLFYPGKRHAGQVIVVDLGYPRSAFDILKRETFLIGKDDVKKTIPGIAEDTYKHRQGKVLIIAGSPGMTGAATLCALGAMRTGAGLVVNAIPASLNPILEVKLTEALTEPLAESAAHTFCADSLPMLAKRLAWSDVVVFGPGVSAEPEVIAFGRELLQVCDRPLVIDADGLRIFHGHLELIGQKSDLVLTPHHGEFAMLSNVPIAEVQADPIGCGLRFVANNPCTLVLKGAPTVIISAQGQTAVNSTGNPGLATGGTGDVLTGMIAALRAQGMPAFEAAIAGVSMHGLAADWGRKKLGVRSLLASDLLEYIPLILKRIEKTY